MFSTSSAESEALALGSNEQECAPLLSVRSSHSPALSCESTGPMSRSTRTFEQLPLTGFEPMALIESMSSAAASPAKTSASPARAQGSLASDLAFGPNITGSSKKSGRASRSSKTLQPFALADWTKCSGRSLRSGMTRSGTVFPLPPLALLTVGTASGSSRIPTPTTRDYKDGSAKSCANVPVNGLLGRWVHQWPTPTATLGTHGGLCTPSKGREGGTLIEALSARMWPTPHGFSQDGKSNGPSGNELGRAVNQSLQDSNHPQTGSLNPTWVEWLMGFPPEWTALEPSGMPSSRKSRKSSGEQS